MVRTMTGWRPILSPREPKSRPPKVPPARKIPRKISPHFLASGSPTGITKEFGEAAHGFAAGFGLVPRVGFFDGTADPDGEESGEDADEVGDAPFVGDFHGGEGGEPGAEDTGGVEDAAGVSAGVFGEDFSNEGGGDGPLATDAHGDEEAEDTYVPEFGGEVGEAGEDGVKEDGEDHDGLAADFVAE